MRSFFIITDFGTFTYDEIQLADFVNMALLQNKDVHHFEVYELSERLTKQDAIDIAYHSGLESEVTRTIDEGLSPLQALKDWDAI